MFKDKFLIITVSIFVLLISTYGYNKIFNSEVTYYPTTSSPVSISKTAPSDNFNFFDVENTLILVIADSHLNTEAFKKISTIIKDLKINLVVHLGDHTDFGSTAELKEAKSYLDFLGLPYIAIPGDRDLAASNGDYIFYTIFNKKTNFSLRKANFLFIDNSPNFTPIDKSYLEKILQDLESSKFIFTSQPLYVEKGNILKSKYMGSPTAFNLTNEESLKNQEMLLIQRNIILETIRKSGNKLIISGDHHRSSNFLDPINKTVEYQLVGAIAEKLNSNGLEIKQKVFQSQRITLLSINKNLEYRIKEIEIFEK